MGITEEDIYRLVHQVQGQAEVDAMRAALEKEIQALRDLDRQLQAEEITEYQHAFKTKAATAAAQEHAGALLKAEEAFRKTGGSASGFGQTLQAGSRIAQDYQAAGLNGIINNLEQMGMGLAKVAGLAGGWGAMIGAAMQGIGVVALALQPQIKALWASFTDDKANEVKSSLDALKDRIKALSEKPIKLAFETRELEEAQKQLDQLMKSKAAWDALSGQKTEAQQKSGKAFETALVEAEPGGVNELERQVRQSQTKAGTLYQGDVRFGQHEAMQKQIAAADQKATDLREAAKGADARSRSVLLGEMNAAIKERDALMDQAKTLWGDIVKTQDAALHDLFTGATAGDETKQKRLIAALEQAKVDSRVTEKLRLSTVGYTKEQDAYAEMTKEFEEREAENEKARKQGEKDDEADIDADMEAIKTRDDENLAAWKKAVERKKAAKKKARQHILDELKVDTVEQKFTDQVEKQAGPAMPFAFGPGMPTGDGMGMGMPVGPMPMMGGFPAMARPHLTPAQRRMGAFLAKQAQKDAKLKARKGRKFAQQMRRGRPGALKASRKAVASGLAAAGPQKSTDQAQAAGMLQQNGLPAMREALGFAQASNARMQQIGHEFSRLQQEFATLRRGVPMNQSNWRGRL